MENHLLDNTTSLKDRAFTALNLNQYSKINTPDNLGRLELDAPESRQYVLRMLIRKMFGDFKIPYAYEWLKPFILACDNYQKSMGIKQPFVYLTIRNGIVTSSTDDEWHVDGFSQTITHLPEQNYIWCNIVPTEYVVKSIDMPNDFDPLKHNIHKFFQKNVNENEVLTMDEKTIYGLDPYIIHRRPKITNGIHRSFVRLSFTPIEIEDVNNTYNPLLETNYSRDGIKEMRNSLIEY